MAGKATVGNIAKGFHKVVNIMPNGEMSAQTGLDYKQYKKIYIYPDQMTRVDEETMVFIYPKIGLFADNKQGMGYFTLDKGRL